MSNPAVWHNRWNRAGRRTSAGRLAQLGDCLITSSSYSCTDYLFIYFCLAKKEKGPWTSTTIKAFPNWIYHNFWMNPWSQTAGSLVLWISTLAICQVHRVRSVYLDFSFFGYENQSDAAADCREVQDVLSTSGLKGNNWFLPTRLERVNFETYTGPAVGQLTVLIGKKCEGASLFAWCLDIVGIHQAYTNQIPRIQPYFSLSGIFNLTGSVFTQSEKVFS